MPLTVESQALLEIYTMWASMNECVKNDSQQLDETASRLISPKPIVQGARQNLGSV